MPSYQFAKTKPSYVVFMPTGAIRDAVEALAVGTGVTVVGFSYNAGFFTLETDVALTAPQQTAVGQLITDYPLTDTAAIAGGAESAADAIPTWAKWTEAHFLDWFQTNVQDAIDLHDTQIDSVTNIAQARTALHTLLADHQQTATMLQNAIRLIIALRNKTWPNLQEPE